MDKVRAELYVAVWRGTKASSGTATLCDALARLSSSLAPPTVAGLSVAGFGADVWRCLIVHPIFGLLLCPSNRRRTRFVPPRTTAQ